MGQRLTVAEPAARGIKVETLPNATLMRNRSGVNLAELHWRYGLPILTLVGTALGLGLARVKPRQGRFARIVPGIGVFVAYYLLLVMGQNGLRSGSWPPSLGLWPVHGLFAFIAVMLIRATARPARV
jgi:lipopolysaccharide export system permease protein